MPKNASFRFNLPHLKHFLVLARTLHFGRASEELHIAQPALTRSIKHLEKALGFQLFERTNRQVKLSAAGAHFLVGAEETLATLERSILHARKVNEGSSGTLRVGYTDFAINGQLPIILKRFKLAFPDITIEPVFGVTWTQIERLDAGTLDVGFVTGPILRDDFESVTVQEEPFVVILYKSHPLSNRERIKLSDLEKERFVLGTPSYWEYFMDHLTRICREAGFRPHAVQHAYNTEGILGLVACEMGITISTTAANKYQREELIVKPISDCKSILPTVCAWKPKYRNVMSSRFVEYLKQNTEHVIS